MKQMFEITVDIQKETNHTDIKFSQNSLNTSELNINIANGGKEFTLLDSDKIIVYFKKPDQKVVFQDKQIEVIDKAKGKINVLLTTQTLIQAGKVYGEISIEREEDGVKKRINTYDFSFEVRSSFSANESIESTNEFQVFDKILETGKVLKDVNVPALIESEKVATEAKEATVQLTNQIGILSENTVEKSSFQNNEQYIQRGGVSPKLIQNSAGAYLITTQKPNKQGYVRFRLKDGIVTTVESQGGKGEFLRVIEVIEVVESFFMMNIPSANSDPTIWGTLPINYVVLGKGQQSIPSASITTKTAGAWVEYQVATPRGVREIEALIYKSSGSSDNINISVDGINVLTGVSFMDATAGFRKIRIPLPTSGTHTVRFTTVKSANMTIGGVNLVDLKDYKPEYNYDYCVNVANNNGNQYVTSTGAMDYALLDADTNLWCGSYHGGETRTRISFVFDGIELTVADGQFKIFNTLEIEQETNIMDKVNTFSRQIFNSDGERELQVIFKGDIKLKTMFVNMATTLDTFTDVLYPVKDSLTATDRVYLPDGTNYVIQKNPTTNQKCITILNQKKISSKEAPFIKKLAGSYCKVYNSNVQSETGFIFKGDSFRLSHIFN